MPHKRRSVAVLIIGVICAFLCSCAAVEAEQPSASVSEPVSAPPVIETEPEIFESGLKERGSVRLAMRLPKSLNPLTNSDKSVDDILRLCYEPLCIYDENQRAVANPALLDHIVVSADGMSAIVTLRQNISWSDGSPVTADDLIFSLNTIKQPRPAPAKDEVQAPYIYADVAGKIYSYQRLSENLSSIQINFTEQNHGLLDWFLFPIIPADAVFPDMLITAGQDKMPKTNGVYELYEYRPSEVLLLRAAARPLREKSAIETLEVLVTMDKQAEGYSFERGLIDACYADLAEGSEILANSRSKAYAFDSAVLDFLGFNCESLLFDDPVMRRNIQAVISADTGLTEQYGAYCVKADSVFHPDSWLAAGGETEVAADDVPDQFGFGQSFRLLCSDDNSLRLKAAERIEELLELRGFNITLAVLPYEEYYTAIETGGFDAFIGSIRLDATPDLGLMLSSLETARDNWFGYKSEEMDVSISALKAALSPDAFKSANDNVLTQLEQDAPFISLVYRSSLLLAKPEIGGCEDIVFQMPYYNANRWFFK